MTMYVLPIHMPMPLVMCIVHDAMIHITPNMQQCCFSTSIMCTCNWQTRCL